MCIIIVKNKDYKMTEPLTKEEAVKITTSNHDGVGMMAISNGELITSKFMGTIEEEAGKLLEWLDKYETVCVHARYGTHGSNNIDNVHPYKVDNGLYMMHNGVLSFPHIADKFSDTWNYVKFFLRPLWFYSKKDIKKYEEKLPLVGADIPGNKFVFLHSSGEVLFCNKDLGSEYKGMWMSNLNFQYTYSKFTSLASTQTKDYKWGDTYSTSDSSHYYSDLRPYGKYDEEELETYGTKVVDNEIADNEDVYRDYFFGRYGVTIFNDIHASMATNRSLTKIQVEFLDEFQDWCELEFDISGLEDLAINYPAEVAILLKYKIGYVKEN